MPEEAPICCHCALPVPAGRRGGEAPWFCCFGCRLARQLALPAARAADDEGEIGGPPTTLLLRLGLGIFLAINIMIASWIPYSRDLFAGGVAVSDSEAALFGLTSYLALFLCTIVMALLGLPLAADSIAALVAPAAPGAEPELGRRVNAQLLIVLGVFSAFLLSVWHTVRGHGSLYFDTAATVLVVVTLGSYLEAGARRRATTSAHRLLAGLPETVEVERGGTGGERLEVDPDGVRVGDRVLVPPGGVVPVDGRIDRGRSRVDESSLTGEARPRPVTPGDRLLAGTQNHDGLLWTVAGTQFAGLKASALQDAVDPRC